MKKKIKINGLDVGGFSPLIFIAGPCQLENSNHTRMIAENLVKISETTGAKFIFKGSFDKANRSSINTERGLGLEEGLRILHEVKHEFNLSVTTDVHLPSQIPEVAEVVDVLQIPAFLSRQTDLLVAAGETGKPVNVKKGQFLAPQDMINVAEKIRITGNDNILFCERGTCFGYNNLVNDFRGLEIMAEIGYPVIFDATHSVQQPGKDGNKSSGERKFVAGLARAACAVGVDGIFIETHQDPAIAPSDGPNMVPLSELEELVIQLISFHTLQIDLKAGNNQ